MKIYMVFYVADGLDVGWDFIAACDSEQAWDVARAMEYDVAFVADRDQVGEWLGKLKSNTARTVIDNCRMMDPC